MEDRATRISLNDNQQYEIMSQISKAPTSVIEKEYTKLEEAIKDQIIARNMFERNLESLQEKANHTDNLVYQNKNDNNAQKLLLQDQRNLMETSTNHFRHP